MPGKEFTEDDLRDYCKNRIAFYKTPKHFFIVKEFPQTASGKIQKFKLRELACKLLNIDPTLVKHNGSLTKDEAKSEKA